MPNNSSNAVIYATLKQQSLQGIVLANGLAAGTITEIVKGATTSTNVHDVCFKSSSNVAILFDIIICTTGQQATASPNVRVSIKANAGNTGSIALDSLASLCPQLFVLDLAGNRVIGLEDGQSLYVTNVAAIAIGTVVITKIARDY